MTLAGYGYPYLQVRGPRVPLERAGPFDCDVWWNEVEPAADGRWMAMGHRIADVVALGRALPEATAKALKNIRKIRCLGAYYRTDIGQTLWPPGSED